MSNKYLTKIAEAGKSRLNELVDPDWGRALGKATVQGGGLALVGGALGKTFGPRAGAFGAAMGAGLGTVSGLKSSFKNQLREQDVHNIKLLGAKERHEMHQARMQKMAQLVSDQAKKDIVGTGTIAALGGVGNVIADKIVHGVKSPAGHMGKTFAIGTGIGLAADYAGLKLSHAYNKHVDGQIKHATQQE